MRSGIAAGHLRIPVSSLRAQFTFNGVLPSNPQPVGLSDRTLDRSFVVLAPYAEPLTATLSGGNIDAGPVTLSVPTEYLATGGRVTLTLTPTPVDVTLDDNPTGVPISCTTANACHVVGTLRCNFDSSQPAQGCEGSTGQMYLNVNGTKHVVSSPAINDNDTTSAFPAYAPVGETAQYEGQTNCGTGLTCTNLLANWGGGIAANLKATWSVGSLFGVYQHNYFFGVDGGPSGSTTAVWQQSNVHSGSAPCVAGSPQSSSARLVTFGNSAESTTGDRIASGLGARTTGQGLDASGRQEVALHRADGVGNQQYAVGSSALLSNVIDTSLEPVGTFSGAVGSSYNQGGLVTNSAGAYNGWTPRAPVNMQPVELMTGTEFTGSSATRFAFATNVFVDFLYDNTGC
jgi:hypothetical protein